MPAASQQEIPIQPVEKPILCKPFEEPNAHWHYDTKTGVPSKRDWRRTASYWFKTERTGSAQLKLSIEAEEESEDLPLVNALRDDVRQWRKSKYENATQVTKQLLAHWWRTDRARRLFFCQLEAVETVIYLAEILASGKKPRWKPALSMEDFEALRHGHPPTGLKLPEQQTVFPTLIDKPNEADLTALTRYGCKMATGSGKTVVMAMLISWAFCNRGRVPGDTRFPAAALVVCPNLTVKERLQVLRPDQTGNYFEMFDIVPSQLMPELQKGKVLVTNWHLFAPESPHAESGRSYTVVNKGEESPEAFARRVLGDLHEHAPLMVLNDEAHHAYRPAPVGEKERLTADDKAEREEATVWISGLDRIQQACGIRFCVDLSATPFYLHGSGYAEGSPFPWLVSDFGLVDAIESGIVKIPRIPVSTSTGRPEPEFFALWKHIQSRLQPGERLPGGKPKPDAVWREAQAALLTLASQWKQRFDQIEAAKPGQEKVPPVLIIVGDNTDIAELFYRNISGEESIEIANGDDDEDEDSPQSARKKAKPKTVFGKGQLFPEHFSNRAGFRPTLRIDSKLLAQAESEDPNASRKEAAEELRRIVDTVGKPGEAGEQIRCVVSVQMLTEGGTAKLRLRSRHQLFPQVCRLVNDYAARKVDFRGLHPCELGLERYVMVTVERLTDAILPDDTKGEPPLLPVLNRYKPIGSTADVNFKTKRPCQPTMRSHLNQVVMDTQRWEQSAAFFLEKLAAQNRVVVCYARNDHLEFSIPYEYLGVSHAYFPDYIVLLSDGSTLMLEIKGLENDQDRAKHQATKRWLAAVNHWGKLGRWRFHVCRDPQMLEREMESLL